MPDHVLVLDAAIRDWVLIPIVLVMFFIGIIRNNITKMIRSVPTPKLDTTKMTQTLTKSRLLRANGQFLPVGSFVGRQKYMTAEKTGLLRAEVPGGPNAQMAAMSDPSMMMGMMKGNLTMMVPQILMMTLVNQFFSGFVLGQVPFPLLPSFRGMLQRGINLHALDVTYVSSLALYFLVMFGMRGLYTLVLGADNETDDSKIMQQQMSGGMGAGQPGQPQDWEKLYNSERESLQLARHDWALAGVEERLIKKVRKNKMD